MNAVEAAVKSVRLRPKADGMDVGSGRIMRLRQRHHMLARMVASGMPEAEIAKACGTTLAYLDMLTEQTPAFIQLVAEYRKKNKLGAAIDTYVDHLERNMIAAEIEIGTRLEEEPDALTVSELHKIARDAADRLGFSKHSVNLNVNLDFAEQLRAARMRSGKVREIVSEMKTIDLSAQQSLDDGRSPEPVALPAQAEPASAADPSSGQGPSQAKGMIRRRV